MAASSPPTSSDHLGAGETAADYDDEEVSAYALQIANFISFPMVMQTAIELDLFEIIDKVQESGRRISAAEIADQLPASDKEQAADNVDRMLRLLAAFSVISCSVDGSGRRVYELAPIGRHFVRDEDGTSFGPMMCMVQDKVLVDAWSKLKDAVLHGGIPFNKAYGMNFFEYFDSHPRINHVFNLAMLNHTTIVMKKVLQHYKGFENLKQLVDVGGGLGHTLQIIVSEYPSLKGINFDLPHVIQHAISFQGIEHVNGDMFESVPSSSEAIFTKWILHDWSDDRCMKLLKNCYKALPNNGKVIVLEHVLADEPETTIASKAVCLMDMAMMTHCTMGRERTKKEFVSLANAAGFTMVKFECYVCNFWVMEFCK